MVDIFKLYLTYVCDIVDNGHSFDQVLFYGQELTLTTFEILMFGLVDMFSPLGFVFSAVIVYFSYLVCVYDYILGE